MTKQDKGARQWSTRDTFKIKLSIETYVVCDCPYSEASSQDMTMNSQIT